MAKFAKQLADSGKITDSVEISGCIKELCLGRTFLPFKYKIKLNVELSRETLCNEVSKRLLQYISNPESHVFIHILFLLHTFIHLYKQFKIFGDFSIILSIK